MFREMRRKKQMLSREDCIKILKKGTSGVLSLCGSDEYPYAVPLSFVYDGDRIFFHSAGTGHKLDLIQANPRASFCVIGQDLVVPKEYTTYFRSVIAFGTIHILKNDEEKRFAIEKLAVKYAPENTDIQHRKIIFQEWNALCVLEMQIDFLTGKEAIELVKERKQK